ncbi:MAG TPA: PEP-CTERM sorting domain-containing protein [Verrucomicrobiae bacterium]|nr:PEP-CTERM sorting domain-containing protein [Verrucomicrobiae bacterium]
MKKKMQMSFRACQPGARVARFPLFAAALLLAFSISIPGRAGTFDFSNTSEIVIQDSTNLPTAAGLYPSTINVSGLDGQLVSHLSITLNGFSHDFPSDVDIVLAGPAGQLAMLMGEVGGQDRTPVSNLTLTLDDSAANSLPIDAALSSGVFKPTRQFPTFNFEFPSPAPAGSANAPASLSVFNGTDPNGAWRLFVVDDSNPDSGTILSGWSMNLVTAVPEPGTVGLFALAIGIYAAFRYRKS